MEEKPQRQPGDAPQSINPADTLCHCEKCITIIVNSLQNFENRKRLTDVPLQNYIDELNRITREISMLAMYLPKTESRRFKTLLRHIYAAIRKFDAAKEAYIRKNNYISHVDEALIKLYDALSECK